MANEEQLAILRQGVEVWNKWRAENPDIDIDLSSANLSGAKLSRAFLWKADLSKSVFSKADLGYADLSITDLTEANLNEAILYDADLTSACLLRAKLVYTNLRHANLSGAFLEKANLWRADLRDAYLRDAYLRDAYLREADLLEANLVGSDLQRASLFFANLARANLEYADLREAELIAANLIEVRINHAKISKSEIYGVNVWNLIGEFEEQKDLIISNEGGYAITVDDIKVAQFIFLILNNEKIRDVINTLTSKSVLILGRFSIPERKAILDALKNKLREHNLLPIVFDFDRPTDKDFTETIKTLASISYFVIADVTKPKSSPLELQATVPDYQIPFVPIIQEGESPFAMMVDLQNKYPWVLPTKTYDSIETLMKALKPRIIDPAVEMRNKLRLVKAQDQVTEALRVYVDKTL